jgi:hypothetical protein
MYEFYLSITGVPPVGENKILVIWEKDWKVSIADTLKKCIHIGGIAWNDERVSIVDLPRIRTHFFFVTKKLSNYFPRCVGRIPRTSRRMGRVFG